MHFTCQPTTAPLELTGQFGGFVFTDAGKRRMLLRQPSDGGGRLLKVPRELRRRIIGKFRAGESIRVAVVEETDLETGVLKQTVTRVLPEAGNFLTDHALPPAAAVSCVVRVCSKKNCWRNGGRELWEVLERERLTGGQAMTNVEIRQVGCLDRCKQAPNADCGSRAYARCSPREAAAILAQGGVERE